MLKKYIKYRLLRILTRLVLGVLIFFFALVLFIRSPWGQGIIIDRAVSYISDKTETEVRIDKLYLTFSGKLSLNGLYLEDQQQDTLIYSRKLEASVGLIPLIRGESININAIDWSGLRANISRPINSESFNYEFLITAFNSTPADSNTPSETTEALEINIGSIHFRDFDTRYSDASSGLKASLTLGELRLDIDKLDLEQMQFLVDELSIEDTEINYQLSRASSAAPVESESIESEIQLPFLSVDKLSLQNVKMNYESVPDQTTAQVTIGDFLLQLQEADLSKRNIDIRNVALNNSDIRIKQLATLSTPDTTTLDNTPIAFEWPDWQVKVDEFALEDNSIALKTNDGLAENGVFDPGHIMLENFNIQANDFSLGSSSAHLSLDEISFSERSGFSLQKLALDLMVDDKGLALNDLIVATQSNEIAGNLSLSYNSINDLINSPETASITANLDKFGLNINEAYIFNPAIKDNQYVQTLGQNRFVGGLQLKGDLNDFDVTQLDVEWGVRTGFSLSGKVQNLLDLDLLTFTLRQLSANTQKPDVVKFLSEEDLGIQLPKNISFYGTAEGKLSDLIAKLDLKTSDGAVSLNGKFINEEFMSFDGGIGIEKLRLDRLLQNDKLDTLSFTAKFLGKGTGLSDLDVKLTSDFKTLRYDGYNFADLNLSANLKDGEGDVKLSFKDQNLDMSLNTFVALDSINQKVTTTLNVVGADLYELGLTQERIKTAFKLQADFAGNSNFFDLSTNITNGLAVYKQQSYPYGGFDLKAKVRENKTDIQVSGNILQLDLTSDASLYDLAKVLERQLDRVLANEPYLEDLENPKVLKAQAQLRDAPILSEVFLQGIERLDTVSIDILLDEKLDELSAEVRAPFIDFQGNQLRGLSMSAKRDSIGFNFDTGWESFTSGPAFIDRTSLRGRIVEGEVLSDFTVLAGQEKLVNISSTLQINGDTLRFHIDPTALILNKKPWDIAPTNQLQLAERFIDIEDFDITNGEQGVTISNKFPKRKNEHVGVEFNRFQLAALTNLLNYETPLAKGQLQGGVIIENPFDNYGILADLSITDLSVLEATLGKLVLDAKSKGSENYELNLSVKGDNTDLVLSGDYLATESGPQLTLDLALARLSISLIEKFAEGEISEATGNLTADVKVSGYLNAPVYTGNFGFQNINARINQLNTRLSFSNEQVKIDNSGLYLNNFLIQDSEDNSFSLDGKVLTKELKNPTFDLKVKADNFRLLNSKREKNDLFYGQANVDANLSIQGDLNIPKLRGSLRINDATDFGLIVPETQVELKARDGVVLFVNRENPDDILTRVNQNESSTLAATLSGYDVQTTLTVSDKATFNIIVDERTGDNLKVSGSGDFSFGLESSGRMSLSGKYQISSGHYETNLYNLVKRKFEIAQGSSIQWSGDPYDADLDISAIYNVRTSAAPLMAIKTSAESESVAGLYQERLPFQVFINVDGLLLKPEISFNLDMPEEERGALGGVVYSQVQQLNNQEDELNKHVFSLLVLNRFFPGAGSDGSNGGPASIALDNVNKVLSGQLNNYSDKLFGNTGLELGFDLNSTNVNGAGSTQSQTQLGISAKKRLFNDRLIVQVGSDVGVAGSQNADQSTPIIGNVSVEYLLTQDRRLRLQGFSKNQYEGVIDGQLTVSGIALIFSREFNKFKELWTKQVKEQVEKTSKEDKKN